VTAKQGGVKAATHEKNLHYLESKGVQYTKTLATLKRRLDDAGATPDLHHGKLCSEGKKLEALQAEVASVSQLLESYHELPAVFLALDVVRFLRT